jgi:uncharacterized protein (DUF736 family)
MSGAIFQNDRKETDKHPDRTGSCTINGQEFWISGWLEKSKDGKPYLSLKFKAKEQKAVPAKKDAFKDDVPW